MSKPLKILFTAALAAATLAATQVPTNSHPVTQQKPATTPIAEVQIPASKLDTSVNPSLAAAKALQLEGRWFAGIARQHDIGVWLAGYQRQHNIGVWLAGYHPVQSHPHSYATASVVSNVVLSTTNPSMCGWNDRSCWHNVGQTVGSINGYPCGGSLPSCCTLRFESGGNAAAQNPSSSASGLWQFMHDTWNGYGGASEAKYADATTQNAKATQVFAGGAGAGNWFGDGCYNGR